MVKLGKADRLAKYHISQLGKQFNSKSSKDGLMQTFNQNFVQMYMKQTNKPK